MSRYIDAEWLLNFFEPYPNDYQTPLGTLRACVDDAPSIDICFCRECKWCDDAGKKRALICTNPYIDVSPHPNFFCGYGEREGE